MVRNTCFQSNIVSVTYAQAEDVKAMKDQAYETKDTQVRCLLMYQPGLFCMR